MPLPACTWRLDGGQLVEPDPALPAKTAQNLARGIVAVRPRPGIRLADSLRMQ